tara:strand:+ start:5064 stop:5828 length:765 start_codon:yes stop_codon:yes gene_type:complete
VTATLAKIWADLKADPDEYFRRGFRRFYNTIETLAGECEEGQTVLDLGGDRRDFAKYPNTATNGFGHYFRRLGLDYTGISYHDLDLRFDRLPFADDSFDIVTSWETIEHLFTYPPGGMLSFDGVLHHWREAHRVLKPEGLFLVATRNRFCPLTFQHMRDGIIPQCYIHGVKDGQLVGGHAREFTASELLAIARITETYPHASTLCRSSLDPSMERRLAALRPTIETFLGRELSADELGDSIYLMGRKAGQTALG